ncbi:polysaccharide deacetylase family protein [Streptomyces sp. NPDC059443]|uniref:polysaccharide deacetylase family protein n=1 Tax=unclassified Streptomyces TaxID=2593676 RepID=UPI003677AEDE
MTTSASALRTAARLACLTAPALAVAQCAPALVALNPVRNRLVPGLSGLGRPDHVALTFDDGPDPLSTPFFLRALDERGIRATFFVLGSMSRRAPGLLREMADAGHEIAMHGWLHRPLPLRGPRATLDDLRRARDCIGDITGRAPELFRPPYGAMSGSAHLAARRLGLSTVLWSAWGRDWSRRATPESVHRTVTDQLRGGGTILLHDSDVTSAPGSWRATLGALPMILDTCAQRGLEVGPLRAHRFGPPAQPVSPDPRRLRTGPSREGLDG